MTAFAYKDLLTYQRMNELLQEDGSVPLTANWDAGSFKIRSQTFESDVATGTAPLIVASTTKVTNLNADLLDNLTSGNGSGNIPISNGTVCTDLNADKLDGNHASAFSKLTYDGTQVFSGASPVAWTDLDLSAYVGSNRALVYLKVKPTSASAIVRFRTNGDTELLRTSFGCTSNGNVDIVGTDIVYFWVLADTGGIVEWIGDGDDVDIDLLVYLVVA